MGNNWTGERLETFIYNETTIEHLHRYALAMEFSHNKNVLDIACGEGYGSNFLAENAKNVIGIDKDKHVISKAAKKYKKNNLSFITGNILNIPYESEEFDLIVCFETIEHLGNQAEALNELKRVLKTDGLLIISTPDKHHHSDQKEVKSKFHVKELYKKEFDQLLSKEFASTIFFQQQSSFSSIIATENTQNNLAFYTGDFKKIIHSKSLKPIFHIAICSNSDFNPVKINSIFSGSWSYHDLIDERESMVKNTKTYKIGRLILFPFRILRNLFFQK